jgi:hypothetical protein
MPSTAAPSTTTNPPSAASTTHAPSSLELPPIPYIAVTGSEPPTPGTNLFGTPRGDMSPLLSPSSRAQSSASLAYGQGPFADITSRASGLLSVHAHASSPNLRAGHAQARGASGGAMSPSAFGHSHSPGLSHASSFADITEVLHNQVLAPRAQPATRAYYPGLSHVSSFASFADVPHRQLLSPGTQTAIREAFQSPPLRALSPIDSAPGSTMHSGGGTPRRAPAKRLRSTMVTGEIEKPWLKNKDKAAGYADPVVHVSVAC